MTNTWTDQTVVSDEEKAQKFVGKHLLVGITHHDAEGKPTSLEQFHGIIDRISLKEGIVVKLHGSNAERSIPMDFRSFHGARPGGYKLRNTGEVVEDPDYIANWNIYPKGYKG